MALREPLLSERCVGILGGVTHVGKARSDSVEVEILVTTGCPNLAELHSYLAAQSGVNVTITELEEAAPIPSGFAGSPTVLIDGTNPFGGHAVDAAACALSPPTVVDVAAELERRRTA